MSDSATHTAAPIGGLVIGALGIVYGDIGTSPLYAFRESFEGHELPVTHDNVLGVSSLIFWALILIISIKYLMFVLRADNHGEGGILALTSLVAPLNRVVTGRLLTSLVLLGLFGTALLYGDGVITPAISVLSAVEGLEVAAPGLHSWVIPIAVGILVGLFLVQRHGTGSVGRVFGPIMTVWFSVLAVLGILNIIDAPEVIGAINPLYAIRYLGDNGIDSFLSLGSIFLVVTGGEALYADLGHFGRRPIELGWFSMVLPCLLVTYFGQGALLLGDPEAIKNPFFNMGPAWSTYPLVILATAATIIASQALISGAFSLTVQAMNFDYLPRMAVNHTSDEHEGQVYVPIVNWALMIGCISLVLGFRSASALAAAYGIAVTATMAITTLLFRQFTIDTWHWSKTKATAWAVPFLVVDFAFFGANLAKIPNGGWFPLLVAVVIILLMTTWKRGRQLVAERIRRGKTPIEDFLADMEVTRPARVPGTSVFMFKGTDAAPPALISNTRHNRVVHEQVVLASVVTDSASHVPLDQRLDVTDLGHGFRQVVMHFGYMEEPDVFGELVRPAPEGVGLEPSGISFFLGRESVISTEIAGMARWRERLFALMLRSSSSASRFFGLPPDRVVEVGSQVEI